MNEPAEVYEWDEEERRIWAPRVVPTMAEWCEGNIQLARGESVRTGPFSLDTMPFQRAAYEAYSDPACNEIVIPAGAQVGKSQFLQNAGFYTVIVQQRNLMSVQARDSDQKTVQRTRLEPMVRHNTAISEHVSPSSRDRTAETWSFTNGCHWHFGAANSAASLSGKTVPVVHADEFGKWPGMIVLEGSPLGLLIQRCNSFENQRMVVLVSTATTAKHGVWPEFQRTNACEYFIPCHECGAYQKLEWKQVRWPKDTEPDQIFKDKLAWYQCIECDARWSDAQKRQQSKLGAWVPKGGTIDDRGRVTGNLGAGSRGFHWMGLLSNLRTFADFAARFLRARADFKLQDFYRQDLGIAWERQIEKITVKALEANQVGGAMRGVVPPNTRRLVAGADVGKRYVHWSVWAFGAGMTASLVDHGVYATVDELEALLDREFEGSDLRLQRLLVDSGYSEEAQSYVVDRHPIHAFANRFRSRVMTVLGRRTLTSGRPLEVSHQEKTPAGKVLRGGFKRVLVDTTFFKDMIAERRAKDVRANKSIRFPENVAADFLEQMASEHKVEDDKGVQAWKHRGGPAPNHYFDTAVYAFAGAWLLRAFKEPAEGSQSGNSPSAQRGDHEQIETQASARRSAPERSPGLGRRKQQAARKRAARKGGTRGGRSGRF